MDAPILLGRILQRMIDQQYAQVIGNHRFGLVDYSKTTLTVTRENGADTPVPFKKLIRGIEAYQQNNDPYHDGPAALRAYGITHIISPVFALLRLIPADSYRI